MTRPPMRRRYLSPHLNLMIVSKQLSSSMNTNSRAEKPTRSLAWSQKSTNWGLKVVAARGLRPTLTLTSAVSGQSESRRACSLPAGNPRCTRGPPLPALSSDRYVPCVTPCDCSLMLVVGPPFKRRGCGRGVGAQINVSCSFLQHLLSDVPPMFLF